MKNINLKFTMKGFGYGETLRPARDWFMVLILITVLLLLSIASNLWMFSQVTGGQTIGTEVPPAATDPASVQAVTTLFEERASEEGRYRSEYRFVDPSGGGR